MPQAAAATTTSPFKPRYVIQRLVDGQWVACTYDDNRPDDPYLGTPVAYYSLYTAETVARSYRETVRVHDLEAAHRLGEAA